MARETPAGNEPSSPEYGPEQLKNDEESAVGRPKSPNSTSTSPGKVNYNTGQPKTGKQDNVSSTPTSPGTVNHDTSGNVSEPEKSLYNDSATSPSKFQLKSMFSSNRKKAAWGGGAAGILITMVVGFIAIVPAELINLEKDVLAYESRLEQHFEQKAAKKVLGKISDKIADKAKNPAKAAADEAAAKAAGESVASKMDDFPTQDLIDELNKQGFDAKLGANGIDLKSPTGETIDLAKMSDEDFNTLETALPEAAAGQLGQYRSVMLDNSGVTEAGIPDKSNEDAVKDMQDETENGATGEEFVEQTEEIDDKGGDPAAQTAADAAAQAAANEGAATAAGAGALKDAVDTVNDDIKSGTPAAKAITDGEKAFESGGETVDVALPTYVATTSCAVEESVTKSSNQRVPKITELLIRHGNLLLTLASQLKSGHITTRIVSQIMNLLNGDPSAGKDPKTGLPAEATYPATSSAAYQRATGGAWDTNPTIGSGKDVKPNPAYTPDIQKGDLPVASAASQIVNEVNAIMAKFHATTACKALTGFWGTITQTVGGAVQLLASISTLGATEAALIAANLAFQIDLNDFVLPDVLTYFTNVGITGAEDAVQWLSNSDVGLDLSFNDYARSIGAAPLTTAQSLTLENEASQEQVAAELQKPLTTRIFALSDPRSFVSRAVMHMPTSTYALMSGVSGYFTNIGSELGQVFSVVMNPHRVFAAATAIPDPYGVTQYAFTDAENEKYDPIDNEAYLFGDITVAGKTIRRIDALGDPNTYVPSPDGDPNDTDLLHCFVDPYGLYTVSGTTGVHGLADTAGTTNPAKTYCGSLGSYDYAADGATLPTANDIADVYCSYAQGQTDPSVVQGSSCESSLTAQITAGDDLGHFRQYLLDSHILDDYETLLNDQ